MCSTLTPSAFMAAPCAQRQPTSRRLQLARFIAPALVRVGLVGALGLAGGAAQAEWIQMETPQPGATLQRYINLDTVRQTGPMSIYRRVQELSQAEPGGSPLPGAGPASIVETVEYDCMSGKVRVLQALGFSLPWGKGDPVGVIVPVSPLNEWRAAAVHPAGTQVLALVCPGEPGS